MSTNKIHVLDPLTINQIKAGEVIEGPASVIKELIDNALDAKASKIEIDVKGGGHTLIRVRDNGEGMSEKDALLALERHATSKITSFEDLFYLHTMGFRGEALPSIASVSKFSLYTALSQEQGTGIKVEGGNLIEIAPLIHDPGTTVEVRSLFFNVPARRKFQKSPAADTQSIIKMVQKLALSHPHIAFILTIEGIRVFSLPPQTLHERIQQLFDPNIHKDLLPLSFDIHNFFFSGFLGSPSQHFQNRNYQYLCINHRPVFSPLISYIMKESFGTLLPKDRHPLFFLHITMPENMVDINVHPQKKEVRLQQESLIKEALFEAVAKAISTQDPWYEEKTHSTHAYTPLFYHSFCSRTKKEESLLLPLPSTEWQGEGFIGTSLGFIIIEPNVLFPSDTKEGILIFDQKSCEERIAAEKGEEYIATPKKLSKEEAIFLLKNLKKCHHPQLSPKGKKTFIHLKDIACFFTND